MPNHAAPMLGGEISGCPRITACDPLINGIRIDVLENPQQCRNIPYEQPPDRDMQRNEMDGIALWLVVRRDAPSDEMDVESIQSHQPFDHELHLELRATHLAAPMGRA